MAPSRHPGCHTFGRDTTSGNRAWLVRAITTRLREIEGLRLRAELRELPRDPAALRSDSPTGRRCVRATARRRGPGPTHPTAWHGARAALRRSRLPRDGDGRRVHARQAPLPLAQRGREGDHREALERVPVLWTQRAATKDRFRRGRFARSTAATRPARASGRERSGR